MITTTSIGTITGAATTITSLITSVFDMMVANPVLVVFLCASLIGCAIGVFRKIKKASH